MITMKFVTLFLQKVQRGDQMLVLSRKIGETIWVGEDIEIVITEVKGDQVKLGIKAPRNIDVIRGELRKEVSESNVAAVVQNFDLFKKKK